jgi:DNA-binding XRE family transcriptional regulator
MQQKELADAVGISRTFMCEIEGGIRTPDLELLGRMANVLDVTVESVKFRGCACGCTCRCHARESA